MAYAERAILDAVKICQDEGLTYQRTKEVLLEAWLVMALKRFNFNQSKTADSLGMHRNTLSRLLEKAGVNVLNLKLYARNHETEEAHPVDRS